LESAPSVEQREGRPPAAFALGFEWFAYFEGELARWSNVVREAGINAE
jgi:hypothetical protein